jgi:hypothetical protein
MNAKPRACVGEGRHDGSGIGSANITRDTLSRSKDLVLETQQVMRMYHDIKQEKVFLKHKSVLLHSIFPPSKLSPCPSERNNDYSSLLLFAFTSPSSTSMIAIPIILPF